MGQQDVNDVANNQGEVNQQDEANQKKKIDKKRITHRRGWGKIDPKKGACGVKYYPSYATPKQYCSKFPNQGERQVLKGGTWTITEASAWLDEEKRLIKDGEWTPVNMREANRERNSVLFSEYAIDFVKNKKIKESTRNKYFESLENHLLPVFGDMRIKSITRNIVKDWYDEQPKNVAVFNAYGLLSQILGNASKRHGEIEPLIKENPCCLEDVSRPKKKHSTVIPSEEQLGELISHVEERFKLAEYIIGFLGLRIGEVLALQRRDIDLKNNILHVRRSLIEVRDEETQKVKTIVGDTKSETSHRDLNIPEAAKPMFEKQLKEYTSKEADAFIFTTEGHTNFVKPSNFRDRVHNKARKQVEGLEEYWPHDGRHATCVYMRDADNTSLNVVSKQLGHSNTQVTDNVYTDATVSEEREKATRKVSERMAKVIEISEHEKTAPSKSVKSIESMESTKPNSNDNKAASGLYAFLTSMEMSARIQALRGMSKEQRKQALDSLSDGIKEETKDAFINSIE